MGLKKPDIGKDEHRGESVGSTSSSPESSKCLQSEQAPQPPSAADNQVVTAFLRPHVSSARSVDSQAARLSRASIHDGPSRNLGAINPRPLLVPAGTSRRDEGSRISSRGVPTTRSQQAHPVTSRREDHPRARPTYLAVTRPQTSSSSAPRREDFPPLATNYTAIPTRQPTPKIGGLLNESRADVSHAISHLRARGILPSLGKGFSIGRGRAQDQSIDLLAHHSGQRRRHIYRVTGADTAVNTDLSTDGLDVTALRGQQDRSVTPTGDQFCPAPVAGVISLPGYDTSALRRARIPTCRIGVGIETEFLLKSLRPNDRERGLIAFGEVLATRHNSRLLGRHPGMDNDLADGFTRSRFGRWALVVDPSMYTAEEPWGIEMVTPLFVAFPSSIWRSHVEATWSHLLQHYEVTSNDECGTHVHISLEGGYSLDELKLVAQAALHFEPSFEALVPEARRHHSESQSSWIDSREFAIRGQSRADSILMISRATSFHTLVRLMQPHDVRGYIWNFRSIFKYYTLEFRKPPASKTANEALAWAELAMSFIQTSIKYGSPERLSRVPPTVGGLRWFLRQHHVAIMNEPNRLNWIWEGLDPNSFVEGRPLGHVETPTQLARIERTIASDERRILQLIQSTREPYW